MEDFLSIITIVLRLQRYQLDPFKNNNTKNNRQLTGFSSTIISQTFFFEKITANKECIWKHKIQHLKKKTYMFNLNFNFCKLPREVY